MVNMLSRATTQNKAEMLASPDLVTFNGQEKAWSHLTHGKLTHDRE